MSQPEQQQIDHWLGVAKRHVIKGQKNLENGFYEREEIPLQSHYVGAAADYAALARAMFLNGDPIEQVRNTFAEAARHILKSFKMAYDESDPDYVGDKWPPKNPNYTGRKGSIITAKWKSPGYGQVSFADVSETYFIDGINYALMAADFDLAAELARWFRDRPDGYKMDPDVNRYAHALAQTLLDNPDKARQLLQAQFDDYRKKPPRSAGDINYSTLITALSGILEHDAARFNEGLEAQLIFYQSYARGEARDTDEEFICDPAVALANLGIHHGLPVTVEHATLPEGLLIDR